MRIGCVVEANVLAVKTTDSQDGTKKYHKLSILLNDEAGMISCSPEVADLFEKKFLKCMDKAKLRCEFNDAYDSFRVISAEKVGA